MTSLLPHDHDSEGNAMTISDDDDFADDFFLSTSNDGAVDRMWKTKPKGPVAAIFVHAGAGYHSVVNEKLHLEVCNEAARLAMKFLQSGATAVDAVEVAIKCLEDKEITNAGYGSNLNIDGNVECDATVVDHLGRSGACGAVPNIRNPISLARLILDTSSVPLSLRRVPPNILVGSGARDFAYEHGLPIIPNDFLVSRNAKDRYHRWSEDLKRAEGKSTPSPSPVSGFQDEYGQVANSYERVPSRASNGDRRDHLSAVLTGTWNEGQPDSPQHGPVIPPESGSQGLLSSSSASGGGAPMARFRTPLTSPNPQPTPHSSPRTPVRSPLSFMNTGQPYSQPPPLPPLGDAPAAKKARFETASATSPLPPPVIETASPHRDVSSHHDSSVTMDLDDEDGEDDNSNDDNDDNDDDNDDGEAAATADGSEQEDEEEEDFVSDTVGAIAVDLSGNIAAASSSGGIGMKHAGRIGPAALVGVGTAVVPADPDDDEGASVAAVTSGTGEHMATTMASHRCAERLYHGCRRGPGGGPPVTEHDEDAVMESFVAHDFMAHPGVHNQASAGAIGVMAVKKTRAGIYFYFAHNTDSFAIASMGSTEKDPLLVMSRLGEGRSIARGGRKIRLNN